MSERGPVQFVSRVACEVLPSVFCERRKCTGLCLCVCLCERERTIGRAHRQHHIQLSAVKLPLYQLSAAHLCLCGSTLLSTLWFNVPIQMLEFTSCDIDIGIVWQDVAGITTMMVLSPWEMFVCLSLCRFCHNNSTARYSDEVFQVQTGCSQRTTWEAVI